MRWIGKITGQIHLLLCLYTALAYALSYWAVGFHWSVGFITLSIPLLWAIHLVIVILGLLSGSRKTAFVSLLMLLLAFPFWSRTFRLGSGEKSSEGEFSILSYNVHQLGIGVNVDRNEKSLISTEGLAFLKEVNPDLLCLQEAFHESGGRADLVKSLKRLGYTHFAFMGSDINEKKARQGGLAIFSKYKLENLRHEVFAGQNGVMKVDVRIGKNKITLIDVHLHSMTLSLRDLVEQREVDGLKSESKKTLSRMKNGFQKRNQQVAALENWIMESENPVIVCGDFNEIPYHYAYGRLSRILANSFEKGGKGFGFTFRNLPYFIRIDNQFYDPDKIELVHFETIRSVVFSDHRPLLGSYTLLSGTE